MHLTSLILPILSILSSTLAGPVVRIHNTKSRTICLRVETGQKWNGGPYYGWFHTTTMCGDRPEIRGPGIWVSPGQTTNFYPTDGWNGAISDYTNAGTPGSRYEINFSVKPWETWFDVDMERGITSGTLGPTDGRRQSNGNPSLAGEVDPLAKANAAWMLGSNNGNYKVMGLSKYITPSQDFSRLVNVYMDLNAPPEVRKFFQLKAKFAAFMFPGSVMGVYHEVGSLGKQLEQMADHQVNVIQGPQDMTITIY
ncbi:MAG: hypothetical protein Q9204_002133 [Flavoplaca sp. TL-2023a]